MQMHSPTPQSHNSTHSSLGVSCALSPDRTAGTMLGLVFLFVFSCPFTVMFYAARTRSQVIFGMQSGPFYSIKLLRQKIIYDVQRRFLFTWSSVTYIRPLAILSLVLFCTTWVSEDFAIHTKHLSRVQMGVMFHSSVSSTVLWYCNDLYSQYPISSFSGL